jgi:hypothetical protein
MLNHLVPTTGDSHVAHFRFAGDRTQCCGAWSSRHSGGGIFGREHENDADSNPGRAVAVAAARADTTSALLRGAQLPHAAAARRLNRTPSSAADVNVHIPSCSTPSYQPQEIVMFRTSIFLAIALGVMATDSAATPAAAFSSQYSGGRNEQIFVHYHPITSVETSPYRFPGKKKS